MHVSPHSYHPEIRDRCSGKSPGILRMTQPGGARGRSGSSSDRLSPGSRRHSVLRNPVFSGKPGFCGPPQDRYGRSRAAGNSRRNPVSRKSTCFAWFGARWVFVSWVSTQPRPSPEIAGSRPSLRSPSPSRETGTRKIPGFSTASFISRGTCPSWERPWPPSTIRWIRARPPPGSGGSSGPGRRSIDRPRATSTGRCDRRAIRSR